MLRCAAGKCRNSSGPRNEGRLTFHEFPPGYIWLHKHGTGQSSSREAGRRIDPAKASTKPESQQALEDKEAFHILESGKKKLDPAGQDISSFVDVHEYWQFKQMVGYCRPFEFAKKK